jgi:RNA polymerase sigma-70 factor (ECF subfamily)
VPSVPNKTTLATAEAELKALMLAGLDGDSAAYRALLHRLSGRLRAYYRGRLGRIGRTATEVEDLVQEALIAIHLRRFTYQSDQPLMPWVHAIARYKLIDHLRATRASLADVPIDDTEAMTVEEDQRAAESAYDLQRLLSRLPDRMRNAIQSVKLEGLSVSEAATRCNMSESAVKISVFRGLKRLAAAIKKEKKS